MIRFWEGDTPESERDSGGSSVVARAIATKSVAQILAALRYLIHRRGDGGPIADSQCQRSPGRDIRMKRAVGVALIMIFVIQSAFGADDRSANELYLMCSRETDLDQVACTNYLMGFFVGMYTEAHAAHADHPIKVCTPGAVTPEQAKLIFLRHARSRPGDLSWPDYIAAREAFREAFPCP
jgi:Ssp1 endopeptidase immunity protein Rap1a